VSTRLESTLSQLLSITRNLAPSQQQLFDGVARFVAILLIYTITISTSVSLGAMPLGAERLIREPARSEHRVTSPVADPGSRTRVAQSISSGATEQKGKAELESRQMILSASVPKTAQSYPSGQVHSFAGCVKVMYLVHD
jgi:hypothetical protein